MSTCNICGLTIGHGTMATTLPLCQCGWRPRPDPGKTHFADDDTIRHIAALEAENAQLRKDAKTLATANHDYQEELKTEVAQLRKDAERLDWLDANPNVIVRSGKQHIRPLIDAAMQRSEK